jgi:uncharacterized membrane protein
MSHAAVTPIKVKITRAWTDLAPKLLAFLTGGTAATTLIFILSRYFDVTIDASLANVIVVVAGTVLGYLVKDKAVIDAGTVSPGAVAVITAMKTQPSQPLEQRASVDSR